MAIKNAIYQVDNGTDFDEIHFRTKASQVLCEDGRNAEVQLNEKGKKNIASKTPSGWIKDSETGVITQWGTFPNLGLGGATITLPISFTDASYKVLTTVKHTAVTNRIISSNNLNVGQIQLWASENGTPAVDWFAIGW